MTMFCETCDVFASRRMRRAAFRTVASACAMMTASLPVAAIAFASTGQHRAGSQISAEPNSRYADFLANYAAWAKNVEAEGMERGTPLSAEQIELASQIGIKHPENVRLVFVDAVPFPTNDEVMRRIGEKLGFIGPGVTNNAQAFGYTIWVRDGFTLDRPSLAHELVHVAQIERSEGFDAFVKRYMMELLERGHADMPLETEAYEANQAYR